MRHFMQRKYHRNLIAENHFIIVRFGAFGCFNRFWFSFAVPLLLVPDRGFSIWYDIIYQKRGESPSLIKFISFDRLLLLITSRRWNCDQLKLSLFCFDWTSEFIDSFEECFGRYISWPLDMVSSLFLHFISKETDFFSFAWQTSVRTVL